MLALSIPQGFEKEYKSGTDEEQHWTLTLDDNGVTATASAAPVDQASFASYGMPTALRRWLDDIDEQYRRMRLWGVDYDVEHQDLWQLPMDYLGRIRARLTDAQYDYRYDGRHDRIVRLLRRIDEHFSERSSIGAAGTSSPIWGIDTDQEMLYHADTMLSMQAMRALEEQYQNDRMYLAHTLHTDRFRGSVHMEARLRFVESRLRILGDRMMSQRMGRGSPTLTATEVRAREHNPGVSPVPRINDVIWDDVLAGFVDEAIHSLNEMPVPPRRRTRRTRRSP